MCTFICFTEDDGTEHSQCFKTCKRFMPNCKIIKGIRNRELAPSFIGTRKLLRSRYLLQRRAGTKLHKSSGSGWISKEVRFVDTPSHTEFPSSNHMQMIRTSWTCTPSKNCHVGICGCPFSNSITPISWKSRVLINDVTSSSALTTEKQKLRKSYFQRYKQEKR